MKHFICVVCMFKVDHNKTCTKGPKSRLQIWVSTSSPFKVRHTRFALFMKFKLKIMYKFNHCDIKSHATRLIWCKFNFNCTVFMFKFVLFPSGLICDARRFFHTPCGNTWSSWQSRSPAASAVCPWTAQPQRDFETPPTAGSSEGRRQPSVPTVEEIRQGTFCLEESWRWSQCK